jgi:adenylosuccinate synthase
MPGWLGHADPPRPPDTGRTTAPVSVRRFLRQFDVDKHYIPSLDTVIPMSSDRERRAGDERWKRQPSGFADVVVGGQAGSEGKGAVVAHLSRVNDYAAAVRPGSSNAGHTVYDEDGDEHVHQVIPSPGVIDPDTELLMAAESSFGLGEMTDEIERVEDVYGDLDDRLRIDPKAAIIRPTHRETERDRGLGEDIGSTVHGCGAVRADKIWRSSGDVTLAEDMDLLSPYVNGRVSRRLLDHGREQRPVIVEGTQGAQLSMNHSFHYPYTTSRDCTASSFLSSVGLPPSAVRDVWVVFRTYPIRSGGNTGPLDTEEIDFETVAERAGYDETPVEFTSVTNRKRRIFEWSWDQFRTAVELNDPDKVALTFIDYLDADNYGVTEFDDLTDATREWVLDVDDALGERDTEIGLLKTGPDPDHVIDLQSEDWP